MRLRSEVEIGAKGDLRRNFMAHGASAKQTLRLPPPNNIGLQSRRYASDITHVRVDFMSRCQSVAIPSDKQVAGKTPHTSRPTRAALLTRD